MIHVLLDELILPDTPTVNYSTSFSGAHGWAFAICCVCICLLAVPVHDDNWPTSTHDDNCPASTHDG